MRHRRSGITRYFAELVSGFRRDPSLGVEPITPYRYVASAHLAETADGYREVPLPGRIRGDVLHRLNARRVRGAPMADLVHHSLYEPRALEIWRAPQRACTVYDFTAELMPEVLPQSEADLAAKRMFLEHCDVLLCISETTRADLARFHPDLDKPVAVTPLGVAAMFFDPAPSEIRGLPDRYLLHVGNRHRHKNVDVLFAAFAAVAATDPALHLVLCGSGLPDEPARLGELGILDRTVVLRVSDAQLPWLYHRSQAFVFPSLYEGFGLPVLEAMAAGCPSIVSDTPALLEVAGDAALTFAPDDAERLAEHMATLIADAAQVDRMRERGRSRAREFTWERSARATARAYDLADGGRTRP